MEQGRNENVDLEELFAQQDNTQQSLVSDSSYSTMMVNTQITNLMLSLPEDKQPLFIELSQQLQTITSDEFTAGVKRLLEGDTLKRGSSHSSAQYLKLKRVKRQRVDDTLQNTRAQGLLSRTPQNMPTLQRWADAQNAPEIERIHTPSQQPRILSIPISHTPPVEVELDLEGMMDVTNYAGVNLKDEEFSLNQISHRDEITHHHKYTESPFLDIRQLEISVMEIANEYSIIAVDDSFLQFLSQAADQYAVCLLTNMCRASKHRANADYDILEGADGTGTSDKYELMVHADDTVRIKLIEIENRERERQDIAIDTVGIRPSEDTEDGIDNTNNPNSVAQSLASSQTITSQKAILQTPDTKKVKRQPSTKKDLPEAVKNKLINSAALMAAGGSMKSWMLPGASIAAPTPKAQSQNTQSGSQKNSQKASVSVRAGSRLRNQKRITIKDALFVMESQRELKASDVFYKWWANVK